MIPGGREGTNQNNQCPMRYILTLLSLFPVILFGQDNPDSYAALTPVQRQLDAYNTGDLETFLSVYSDTVRIYNYPDELLSEGKEAMRTNYGRMFDNLPDLHCRLVSRITMGSQVVDHESVLVAPDQPAREVIAIYTVTDGLITEVRFMR